MEERGRKIFEVGERAALRAGDILMENFRQVGKVSKKEDGSLVTNVDVRAEEAIIALIKKNFPDHGILSEEGEEFKSDSEYRWIIDPIDGTHNYIYGLEIFGVSIGVMRSDEPLIGIIYFPFSKQFYHCQKGKGAYLNGKKIHVSARTMGEAFLAHNSNFRTGAQDKMLQGFKRLINSVFKVRMLGACIAHLSHIADGRIDVAVEYGIKLWDLFSGALLVEEAGGKVTDLRGKPWQSSSGCYVASNGIFHHEILNLLKDSDVRVQLGE